LKVESVLNEESQSAWFHNVILVAEDHNVESVHLVVPRRPLVVNGSLAILSLILQLKAGEPDCDDGARLSDAAQVLKPVVQRVRVELLPVAKAT
jgi:hypothetical protein